ncbi:peptidase, M48 domain protein [Bacteriovorax sp. BSW11_IV]|uniref:M48 family metalloprotease n=1 Tax=Bacteriovorax sp. BSW11_IV TaxID=1353529 RepID=UPI00038A16F4|nr:M48 family metalloprotease [Bacteriovorax sp. BSW11_IV]EQC44514.1 peptidase, M48 domain protein [Bacteriovorax sp. BSW11_IV]
MIKYLLLLAITLFATTSHAVVDENTYQKITNLIKSTISDKIDNKIELKFTTKVNELPNAFAKKNGKDVWEITVHDSLLTLNNISSSSLAMILCHEVGHFMGDKPYVQGRQLTPAVRSRAPKEMSCEGQADYYAATSCLKDLIANAPELFNDHQIFPNLFSLNDECQKNRDPKICENMLHISYETTLVYQDLMRALDVHERFQGILNNNSAERTLNYVGEYPTLDCRFETFVRGTLCNEENTKECEQSQWSRPSCWFVDSD